MLQKKYRPKVPGVPLISNGDFSIISIINFLTSFFTKTKSKEGKH